MKTTKHSGQKLNKIQRNGEVYDGCGLEDSIPSDVSSPQNDLKITTLIKNPAGEIDKLILKFMWKCTGAGIPKIILGKEEEWVGELKFPDLKVLYIYYYRLCNQDWYWRKSQHIDQWNKIEGLKINPYLHVFYVQQSWPRKSNGEMKVFPTNGTWHPLIPYININLIWIIDLNVETKTRKLLEEHRRISLQHGVGKGFWGRTQMAISLKIDQIKMKNFCSFKDIKNCLTFEEPQNQETEEPILEETE